LLQSAEHVTKFRLPSKIKETCENSHLDQKKSILTNKNRSYIPPPIGLETTCDNSQLLETREINPTSYSELKRELYNKIAPQWANEEENQNYDFKVAFHELPHGIKQNMEKNQKTYRLDEMYLIQRDRINVYPIKSEESINLNQVDFNHPHNASVDTIPKVIQWIIVETKAWFSIWTNQVTAHMTVFLSVEEINTLQKDWIPNLPKNIKIKLPFSPGTLPWGIAIRPFVTEIDYEYQFHFSTKQQNKAENPGNKQESRSPRECDLKMETK
jgi:hypothetical protein